MDAEPCIPHSVIKSVSVAPSTSLNTNPTNVIGKDLTPDLLSVFLARLESLNIQLQRVFYALRRSGASSGGVISNALAVQHVIENEPTRATRATSSSVLKDASADA